MRSKEMILKYFLSQLTLMEDDVHNLQSRARSRNIGVNDSFEMAVALIRLELMLQVFKDVSIFLNIDNNAVKR